MIVEKILFDLYEEFDKLNLRLGAHIGVVAMEVDSMLPRDIYKG
jgi:hypothetical protein